mmetsp:Transcript_2462/g.4197  ORF Transcript_2462/g.4197 Transcript_2462/m.4197 type:complete len:95 (+) Transcript_2462:1311-1595(+)
MQTDFEQHSDVLVSSGKPHSQDSSQSRIDFEYQASAIVGNIDGNLGCLLAQCEELVQRKKLCIPPFQIADSGVVVFNPFMLGPDVQRHSLRDDV